MGFCGLGTGNIDFTVGSSIMLALNYFLDSLKTDLKRLEKINIKEYLNIYSLGLSNFPKEGAK